MKKGLALWMAVLLLCTLTGCGRYRSHYRAVGFVHSAVSDHAFMSFFDFDGTMVFKLKCTDDHDAIRYTGKLQTGSAKVYYDCGGTKTELFSVHAGEEVDSSVNALRKGTVYVIVETDGACENGSFDFTVG